MAHSLSSASAHQQEDDPITAMHEIKPIPRPNMHAHFMYPVANRFAIAQVAFRGHAQPGGNPQPAHGIAQVVQPSLEGARLLYGVLG